MTLGVGAVALTALLLLAMRQSYIVPYTGLGQSPAQLLALLLTAAWGLSRLRGGRGVPGLLAWRLAAGGYLLAALVSYVAANARGLPEAVMTTSDRALITRVAVVGFAVLVVEVVRTRRQLELLVGTVVVAAAVSAFTGVVQFATGVDLAASITLPGLQSIGTGFTAPGLREGSVRAQGAASTALEFGAVVTVAVPLAVVMFTLARRRGTRAWPWALAGAVLLAGGAVSLSRSVFVGLAAAFVVLAAGWPVRRTAGLLAGFAALAGLAWVLANGLARDLADILTQGTGDYSLQSRSDGRTYVAQQVLVHPWLGQGVGTYQTGVQPVLDNQYLSELIETGFVGLAALVAVLLTTFVGASRARVLDPDPDGRDLTAGLSAALAVVAVVNLVLDTSGFAQVFVLGWLVVGLCGAATQLGLVSHRQFGDLADGRVGDGPPAP